MVIGPAWSGKTKFAEELMAEHEAVLWLGTGSRLDPSFSQHIDHIASRRPKGWQTIEASYHLAAAIQNNTNSSNPMIIDSMSQWLANILAQDASKYSPAQLTQHIQGEIGLLLDVIRGQALHRQIVIVTAEMGSSVAPEAQIPATLRRANGLANQELALLARTVYVMCAGIGQIIKSAR